MTPAVQEVMWRAVRRSLAVMCPAGFGAVRRTSDPDGFRASSASLNHFVRAGEDRWRDRRVKRRGGLQVDHQLEPGRPLDRQVCGLGSLEDLVDEHGGALEILSPDRAVERQTAVVRK